MKNELIQLVRDIGSGLSDIIKSTAPQVWEMARMKLIAGCILWPFGMFAAFCFVLLVAWKITCTEGYKDEDSEEAQGLVFALWVSGCIFLFGFVIMIFVSLNTLIALDYYTLKTIIEMMH